MCEFKEKQNSNGSAENMKLTIATIEGGNVNAIIPDPGKSAEYFESALEATTFGKFNYCLILVSGLILANVLLETLGISFVLPAAQCEMNLSLQEHGILSAIGFAGIISSSHLWGFLADTTGRRHVIRPTLLLGFVVTVLSSFSTNFWLMVILRYINGFCISGGSATIYVFLGEFHTAKNRSGAIMISAFIFGIGSMMMPCLAWLVINKEWSFVVPYLGLTYKPWRLFMVVCGIPGLLCGLALFKIPESPKFLLSQGNEKETLEILQTMFHLNTNRPRDEYPISHVIEDIDNAIRPKIPSERHHNTAVALLRSMWNQTQPLFNREYMRTTILICFIQFWIFFTSNGMYVWFPHILNNVAAYMNENPDNRTYMCQVAFVKPETYHSLESDGVNLPTEQCNEKLDISTYANSLILEVLYAVGFALIGAIISKVGKSLILFVCLTACGICGIAAVYVDIPIVAVYLYAILLLCGLGINVLSAATVDFYPTRLRAMAVCISLMMGRLGSVVGANVFGALLSNYCDTAFIVSGVSLIVSGTLGFLLSTPGKKSGKHVASRRTSLVSMTGN